MLVVPNNHVIVPRTEEISVKVDNVVNSDQMKRRAHVRRYKLNNATMLELDFQPISDQWLELYLDGYRMINPKYPTFNTVGIRYETYNLVNNHFIRFENPITGNLKVISDTLSHAPAESYIDNQQAGVIIDFDNIQNYDVFEKRFNPSRYPMPQLELVNSVIRIRVGDAHYAEPLVLTEPCYGHVRLTKDRKNFVYTPRPGYRGQDVFGYTLITTHGQIGMPQGCTVTTGGDAAKYNWSTDLDGYGKHLAVRDLKHPFITALANKKITIEFYYYTRTFTTEHNYKVGMFGQYRDTPTPGRFAIYLQGTGVNGDQVVVVQYCISSVDIFGNPVFSDYKVSSKAKLSSHRWHHVVVQIDATDPNNAFISMYLDGYGEFFYNNDFTAHTTHSGDYFLIGKVNDLDTSQIFNGYVSNFRILLNDLPYTGERIAIPRRTLGNIATAKILGIVNSIEDPQSVTDMTDLTRIQKIGNVKVVEVGPFSPVVLSSNMYDLMHGDTVRISTWSDYICKDTVVDWEINANIKLNVINERHWSNNGPSLSITCFDEINEIYSTPAGFSGNFIIDDIDSVEITVDTHTNLMTSLRQFDFYLKNYPLMIETFTVYADPDGLVLSVDASNDGFARDSINFNHAVSSSIVSYNPSLGGYFDFNGTSDIMTGVSKRPINIVDDVTCQAWFRVRNPAANDVRIFGKGVQGNISYGIYYNTSNNSIIFNRNRISSNINVEHRFTSSMVSNWYHVAAVSRGIEQEIYVNGVLVKQELYNSEPSLISNMGFTLGSEDSVNFHDGQISKVRLHNRALTAVEILAEFNLYRSNYGL